MPFVQTGIGKSRRESYRERQHGPYLATFYFEKANQGFPIEPTQYTEFGHMPQFAHGHIGRFSEILFGYATAIRLV